jgi:hypothetical protein
MRITSFVLVIALFSTIGGCSMATAPRSQADTSAIERAFEERQSGIQVEDEGVVTRILNDDKQGARHQRFILRVKSGRTLLIQHNIDLAPRIPDLNEGDLVGFFGEYEWNDQGGLVHWTHYDPTGQHVSGWLKHKGRTYRQLHVL